MKFYKYYFLSLAFVTVAMTGCKEADIDNEHHYDNKLYISSQPICDDLLIKESITEASRSIAYRIASPAEEDIQIDFEAAPAMTASYNLIYGDNATALAADYYDIPKKTATIKTGDISSDDIVVNFKNTNELDDSKRYVLPVTITGASKMAILGSHRTAYFVFKGAALINVVANIKKLYFPIKWKSNVSSMSTITIEALLRSDDWVAGRDNALSSVFGIEGKFLVRIGDADRPRDQVQVVAPGGNFPEANAVPGLPVNEWVHIAIVYDATTGERIFYKDGVRVYGDEAASGKVSLTSGCNIGKSYNEERWLPGDIAEVRIWNVQRTAEQIAKNPYKVSPDSEGLVAYWKFNEGTGGTIRDHTGHGNDITAVGGDPKWINVEIPAQK